MSDQDLLARLGAQVRTRRLAAGLTQTELAEAAGYTRSSIANMEAGRQGPPYKDLVRLAEVLGLSIVELITTELDPASTVAFDVPKLFARLDALRVERDLNWRQVAGQCHVSASTLTRISQGQTPSLDGLARLLVWLGDTDLEPYLSERLGAHPEEEDR